MWKLKSFNANDMKRSTWLKILLIFILDSVLWLCNYSFLYENETVANICQWIDPAYLVHFVLVGIVGCICLCRQRIKEFSSSFLNRESLIVVLVNLILMLFIIIAGEMIGCYEVNWIGVFNRGLYCYIFIGVTEEWIYRGFMITQMKKIMNHNLMIVICSTILFSLMHLPNFFMYPDNITWMGIAYRLLIPFLMGLVYAHIYLCNGNLLVLIVLHGSYDLIENVAFDSWYYVSYGICWIFMIAYCIYCYVKKKGNNSVRNQ